MLLIALNEKDVRIFRQKSSMPEIHVLLVKLQFIIIRAHVLKVQFSFIPPSLCPHIL